MNESWQRSIASSRSPIIRKMKLKIGFSHCRTRRLNASVSPLRTRSMIFRSSTGFKPLSFKLRPHNLRLDRILKRRTVDFDALAERMAEQLGAERHQTQKIVPIQGGDLPKCHEESKVDRCKNPKIDR